MGGAVSLNSDLTDEEKAKITVQLRAKYEELSSSGVDEGTIFNSISE